MVTECPHRGPELPPLFALVGRQPGESFGIAHAGEVGGTLPVLHHADHQLAVVRFGLVELLNMEGQIGPQAVQGLATQPGSSALLSLSTSLPWPPPTSAA